MHERRVISSLRHVGKLNSVVKRTLFLSRTRKNVGSGGAVEPESSHRSLKAVALLGGAVVVGGATAYYFFPGTLNEVAKRFKSAEELNVGEKLPRNTGIDVLKNESSIERKFEGKKYKEEKRSKNKVETDISKKLEKLEKRLSKFTRDEKRLSQSLMELRQKITPAADFSHEEFVYLSEEIAQRSNELQACVQAGEKCQSRLNKLKRNCEVGQIDLVLDYQRKLDDRGKSLAGTCSIITFSESELNNAVGRLHELKQDQSLWASDKVNLDEISSQELSNAYSEAQTKLKTMRCLLISQFLNQEKHKTGTGLSGGVTSSTAMNEDFDSEVERRVIEERKLVEAAMDSEKELIRAHYEAKRAEELEELRKQHAQTLSLFSAKIRGIETAVESKADSQRKALYSHYMWLASEAFKNQLYREVNVASEDANELDAELLPLHQFLRRIEIINHSENEPLVSTVLSSLSPTARSRGVYTEDMLKCRFQKVFKTSFRLGKVDSCEGRDSLYSHVLSLLRSMFSFNSVGSTVVPTDLDVHSCDNYKLLGYAKVALDRGDVSLSVKLLNNLKGKPAEVVQDWVREARLFLEAKQAARVLSLFSTATGFATQPLS